MFKRMIALTLAIGLMFLNIPTAFAASLITRTITGTGTLPTIGTNTLTTTLVANTGTAGTPGNASLQFVPSATDLVPQGDELVKIAFTADNNSLGTNFKSVLIYTDNKAAGAVPLSTGDFPSGLVNASATAVSVPLNWVIFKTAAEAIAYTFFNYVHGVDPFAAGRIASEAIDSRIQAFISDKSGSGNPVSDCDAALPGVQVFCPGFATSIYSLVGTEAEIANFPYRDTCGTPLTPKLCDNNSAPVGQPSINRKVTNGEAYVLLVANFNGASAGTYTTSKFMVEMVNNV